MAQRNIYIYIRISSFISQLPPHDSVLKALTVYPLELLRLGPLAVVWFKMRFMALTKREKSEAEHPGHIDLAAHLPCIHIHTYIYVYLSTYLSIYLFSFFLSFTSPFLSLSLSLSLLTLRRILILFTLLFFIIIPWCIVEMLIMLLGFTYATVNPIVAPFALIFFVFGLFTYRYLFLFVYVQPFDGLGAVWPSAFNLAMIS